MVVMPSKYVMDIVLLCSTLDFWVSFIIMEVRRGLVVMAASLSLAVSYLR